MKHITKGLLGIFLSAILVTSCSKDDDQDTNSLNSTDSNFMQMAAYANANEISLGQLALAQSTNDSIKQFAQQMVDGHTMAQTRLDSIAMPFNLNLPTTIDATHDSLRTQLMALSGNSFDSAYIKSQVTDHTNTISLFQDEVSNGSNQSIVNYASQSLPILNNHLQMADSLAIQFP